MDVWETLGLAGQRAILLHHDDLGLSLSTNRAYLSLEFPTGSIMMAGGYAPQLREGDLGVHLTLTSEWEFPRMRPLTSNPTLRDEEGYFWRTLEEAWQHIGTAEAEAEMRAQIDAFYATGREPTHIDTHMGAVLRPDIAACYHQLAMEYRLPCLMPRSIEEVPMPAAMRAPLEPILSSSLLPKVSLIDSYTAPTEGRTHWYQETLKSLPPGVYHLRHHAAVPSSDTEMLPDAHIRIGDYEALRHPEVRSALSSFVSITYREVRDAWRRLCPP